MKRVLLVPMAAMAETAGSFARVKQLSAALIAAGHEVAVCCAEDVNYSVIEDTVKYPLSVPVPLGMPEFIGKHTFPIAQKLGVTSVKKINSFEDVLYITGNISYKYLNKSVTEIRRAIKEFRPDIVYSEFNISAITAARLEGKRCFISASVPTQTEYGCNPKYATGLNRLLKEHGLDRVGSCLDVFEWAEKKFVPSCYELEPIEDSKVVYCGTLKKTKVRTSDNERNKIVAYMGNGTISVKKMQKEVSAAFAGSRYEVYIAGHGLKESVNGNIYTAPYFDFSKLLPESVLYINHGGQNSMTDGLINSVPLLICPGKVFERKYNASSVVNTGAGLELSYEDFNAENIRMKADSIIEDESFSKQAAMLGRRLLQLGGCSNIVRECEIIST